MADYRGSGWQASHGFFALATGGLLGRGIGASNQKWGGLPEAHTDYIFAIIGEEFGLFGTLVVLGLFATLAYAGVRIAPRTKDPFVRYASAGIVVWLLAQAMINIGMVLGLLPVIGIPLPLISYGGSALLPTLVALGLLLGFATTEPGARAALRQRRRLRCAGPAWPRRRVVRARALAGDRPSTRAGAPGRRRHRRPHVSAARDADALRRLEPDVEIICARHRARPRDR